ncbi:MAG: FtsX-like permease family protein [Planctomycetes bacterium]|nr:FtsX-like permease family protein [Planctomycetota bacterium]
MSLWRLILSEIRFRKLNFLVGVSAVVVAVACLVAQVNLLEQHDRRTEKILAAKEKETAETMAGFEDEMRIITKNLGFNIRILPKDLNLVNFYAKDYADKYMPEEYVARLSNSRLVTINHLLPTLQQKVEWPERAITIVLAGTRGEVPIAAQNKKKPIQEVVSKGKIILGFQLHRLLTRERGKEVTSGDFVVLRGRTFVVHKLQSSRGDADDITAWIALEEAQEMLDKKGLINGMLALGCNCAAERLGQIRQEIAAVLPDTQVEEFETKATARAEARSRTAEQAKAAIERERKGRESLREEKEAFASILVPTVLAACAVWLGLMAFLNVLERRSEIGLLRALGLRSRQLLVLFLARAMLLGFTGAVIGYVAGKFVGTRLGENTGWSWSSPFEPPILLIAVLVGGPLISALACWLPALAAARQDPAIVLQQEST